MGDAFRNDPAWQFLTGGQFVAHPGGELFRRMRQGHDLLPLAPKSDVDLAAAWNLSRLLKRLEPDVVHAHDPHAVSMAATALSIIGKGRPGLVASRRAEFRIAMNSLSRWKYAQVDCFIATCDAVRSRLVADGIIAGGMIPKVETCIYALEQGVEGVVILDGKVPHAVLLELFTDHGAGTLMHR